MLILGYFTTKDRHLLYYLSGLGFLVLSIVFSIVDNEISFIFQSAAGIFFVFILYQAFLQAYIFSNAFIEIDHLSEEKSKLEKRNVELFSLSYIDNLTETCNRRLMDDFLASNWRVNAFSERSVGIILIDIDDFSNYNDTYGHKQGDACLVKVCDLLRDELSRLGQDTLARYGGEEFAVIVSDMDEERLFDTAEKLRTAVESGGIRHPSSGVSDVVTISIGCASMIPSRDELPETLLDAAAKALHEAKVSGKNRTEIYGAETTVPVWEPRLV
jgi:diguanylate cyclase (GGDEF)-like protein